jgi:hypothetical protein
LKIITIDSLFFRIVKSQMMDMRTEELLRIFFSSPKVTLNLSN